MQRVTSTMWLRALGAVALFVVAADHFYEYFVDHYSAIPTIGALFLLNGLGAIAIATMLVAPAGSVLSARKAETVVAVAAIAGIGLALTTLLGLFVSESTPLFGFMEAGYRPLVLVAIASEAVAAIVLTALLALHFRRVQLGPAAS